ARARVGGALVALAERRAQLREGRDHRERAARVPADRVALEVPGHVLAQVAHALALVAVEVLDHELAVPVDRGRDLAQPGTHALRTARERGREIGEEPGAALAAAPDDDAVAARLAHHAHGVLGGPDVAVAEHGHARDGLLEAGDRGPVGGARVVLGGRARV